MKTTLEMALRKLAAAHAIVSEAEWFVKKAMAEETGNSAPIPLNAEKRPSDASAQKTINVSSSQRKAVREAEKGVPAHSSTSPVVQGELFTPAQFAEQKRKEQNRPISRPATHVRRIKGMPKVSRREAMANFREIAGGKSLLDLADVNRIFGFNRSTSGTFVKNAVANGKLIEVPVGAKRKFVAKDVKRFISAFFSV